MQNQNPKLNEISTQEAMRIAGTPEGKQLLKVLQENGGEALQQAMTKAVNGDFSQAKQAISALMGNPEVKKLLEQLGRKS